MTTALSCTAGDAARWTVTATDADTGAAVDLTGWAVWWVLSGSDGLPVLALSTADSVVVDLPETGIAEVALTPAQTADLPEDVLALSVYAQPDGSLQHDPSDRRTLLSGTLTVERVPRALDPAP